MNIEELMDENLRLKAEVERLTAFTTRTIIPNEELQAEVKRLTEEREQMESHYEDDTQTIAELRKELADAQESNHILNETIARLMKGAKR